MNVGSLPMLGKVSFPYEPDLITSHKGVQFAKESFYAGFDSIQLSDSAVATISGSNPPVKSWDDIQLYVKPSGSTEKFVVSFRTNSGAETVQLDFSDGSIGIGEEGNEETSNLETNPSPDRWYRLYVRRNKNNPTTAELYTESNRALGDVSIIQMKNKKVRSVSMSTGGGLCVVSPILGPSLSERFERMKGRFGKRGMPEITESRDGGITTVESFGGSGSDKGKSLKIEYDMVDEKTHVANTPWGTFLGKFATEGVVMNSSSGKGGFPALGGGEK